MSLIGTWEFEGRGEPLSIGWKPCFKMDRGLEELVSPHCRGSVDVILNVRIWIDADLCYTKTRTR
jgi:hypothetical protein